jgi:C-terminal processing protease CtpA/Prc
MKSTHKILTAILALAIASLGCKTLQPASNSRPTATKAPPTQVAPTPTGAPTLMAPISANQTFKITGSLKSSSEMQGKFSDNILFSERQVMLIDMHGFINRDKDWLVPVDSQVIGNIKWQSENASGSYTLILPQIPQGTLNDVDNNDRQDLGVQIFAVDYEPNITGDPFKTGDDSLRGWPGNQASIKVSQDDEQEVTGGKLVVYAPDDKQLFPENFGVDGKLFSADDTAMPIPAGYSIIDLDTTPFTVSQAAVANLPLYESPDAAPKDYSSESYLQAFDHLVEFLRKNYAFNGIASKQPDWNKLVTEIRPRVEQAGNSQDAKAYYEALRDFTYAFKDGHSGMDGGDFVGEDFRDNYAGGLGYTARILDDQRVLVNSVLVGSPAQSAGLKVGAIITEVDGKAVMDVIKAQPLFFGNQSSEVSILKYKAIMLTRTKPGTLVQITFTNPGEKTKTAKITAEAEVDSLLTELGYNQSAGLVPVELDIFSQDGKDIGYIKINTNIDDLNLILRLFERGLRLFSEKKVAGIIIDLRENGGGVPLGLAGYLTDQDIPLGQMEYYDDTAGKFIARGDQGKFTPMQSQYRFDKIAVMVGLQCASACEMEAYAFGQLDGAEIIAQYPSSGIEAEVSKGQVKMPEGIRMQFPTGRIVNPDGSLFLEGVGVQPTIKVPVDEENVLSSEDVVLLRAKQFIVNQ